MTAQSKDLLASFRSYFSVGPARSATELESVYRIRYRVYCDEFGYERKEEFPDQMETDEFDETSTHALITHLASGMPAGCVRICPGSIHGEPSALPLNKCCEKSLDPARVKEFAAPPQQTCEASRFAVDGAFRRRSGEGMSRFGEISSLILTDHEQRTFPLLSLVLMLAGVAMAELSYRPFMYAVMEPFLPRLLKRSGLHFLRMGKDINHHGTRAVYITDTRYFVHSLEGEMQKLYTWVRSELASGVKTDKEIGAIRGIASQTADFISAYQDELKSATG